MSISTEIVRFDNNINNLKQIKQNIKNIVNNDFDEISNEQIENYAQKIEDTFELYKDYIPNAMTEKNTAITIDDAMAYNKNKIDILGNIEQKQYNGNQLIDFSNASAGVSVSTSFENDIFTVTSSTGSYRSCYFVITDLYKANTGKTLKFVYDSINASVEAGNKVQINVRKTNDTTQYISLISSTYINYPHTIPNDVSDVAAVQFVVYTNNTNTSIENASITITKPMLQFGTEDKDYEPYVGRSSKSKSRLSTRN